MLFDEKTYSTKLSHVVEAFKEELKTIRTGKATADMFKNINVDQYGVQTQISYVATFKFDSPISVEIRPFNKGDVKLIADAIRNANIGASVVEQADHVRLNFPPLTQEDRDNSSKILGKILEEYRVRARNLRQDYMQEVKAIEGVSEDEKKFSEKKVQDMLDKTIEELENFAEEKDKEINPNKGK